MIARRWRLLRDPPASGAWNMAVDEALLLHCGDRGPALRLYAWSEPTVSLGARLREGALVARCARTGVPVVRRPTGGGAVLHARDLTYAVVAPTGCPDLPDDLAGSYARIRSILIRGLRRAGIAAEPARATPGGARAAVCFAGAVGAEIAWGDRKIVGSAQRRSSTGLLQHGSIRLWEPPGLAREVLGDVPAPRGAPPGCTPHRVADRLIEAFEEAVESPLVPARLGRRELLTVDTHLRHRRTRPLWTALSVSRMPQRAADTVA